MKIKLKKVNLEYLILLVFAFLFLFMTSCAETSNKVDKCKENPCKNEGICKNSSGTYTCECKSGFSGDTCEININECESSPCIHGECRDEIGSYSCSCDAGYSGINCDVNIDDCKSNPCIYGTCTDGDDSYTCSCEAGYKGRNCDQLIDLCTDNNGGCEQICDSSSGEVVCSCDAEYKLDDDGVTCIEINNNECVNNSDCLDDEYCFNIGNRFKCSKCDCNIDGTASSVDSCDETGACFCSELFDGLKCENMRHLKIFVTENRYDGDLGGIEGADQKCNNDMNIPDSHYYKALLGGESRDLFSYDWPLEANLPYYTADGVNFITSTNENKWFNFEFDNPIAEGSVRVWTGLRANGIIGNDNCEDWSMGYPIGKYGVVGEAGKLNDNAIDVRKYLCDKNNSLYCVEQICPQGSSFNFDTGLCEY